jgi:small subunit ribosomal protein S3
MIEKQIMKKKVNEYLVHKYVSDNLPKGCYSSIELKKTPFGEKIIIHTSRPGLIVGRKGENITSLTEKLKAQFKMENPQIEIAEIENPSLDPRSVADRIANSFERFGPKRFKSVGYKNLQSVIDAGAIGAEITIGGRGVPSSRARTWRFTAGHIKKSGDIAENKMKRAKVIAHLNSGAVGIQVSILTPDIELPDEIKFLYNPDEKPQETQKKTGGKEEKKSEEGREGKEKTKKPRQKKSEKKDAGTEGIETAGEVDAVNVAVVEEKIMGKEAVEEKHAEKKKTANQEEKTEKEGKEKAKEQKSQSSHSKKHPEGEMK